VTIYVGVVAHCSLVPTEVAGMGRPFLPALILVVIVAASEPTLSILLAGLLGLMLDGLSTERLGVHLALAAMLALGLQLLQSMWRSRSALGLIAMTIVTCLVWRLLGPLAQAMLSDRKVDPHSLLTFAVQDSAWTAAVATVLILLARGLVGPKPEVRVVTECSTSKWATAR
jgi:rod shape-determining protein MreD